MQTDDISIIQIIVESTQAV